MSLVWQSVSHPEMFRLVAFFKENGFPRQCAHWLGMTVISFHLYDLTKRFLSETAPSQSVKEPVLSINEFLCILGINQIVEKRSCPNANFPYFSDVQLHFSTSEMDFDLIRNAFGTPGDQGGNRGRV